MKDRPIEYIEPNQHWTARRITDTKPYKMQDIVLQTLKDTPKGACLCGVFVKDKILICSPIRPRVSIEEYHRDNRRVADRVLGRPNKIKLYYLSRKCIYCDAKMDVRSHSPAQAKINLDAAYMGHMDYFHHDEQREQVESVVHPEAGDGNA